MAYVINGQAADLPAPEDIGGVTFVPMAKIVEMLGGYVTWDNQTKTASIELGSRTAEVQLDNGEVTTGGGSQSLASTPSMAHGALWVPIDLFSNVLGCSVTEDGANITISSA